MDELLKDFSMVITVPILWGDMDAFQHVNNTVYFRHFEHARIAYFGRLRLDEEMKAGGIGPILAETSCRFRIPLTYPDQVSVGTRVTRIEDDRFTMEYRVVSHNRIRIAAEGFGTIVAFDYRKNAKASLTDGIRKKISEIEGRVGDGGID